jgi:hypothetical protein
VLSEHALILARKVEGTALSVDLEISRSGDDRNGDLAPVRKDFLEVLIEPLVGGLRWAGCSIALEASAKLFGLADLHGRGCRCRDF